MKTKVERIINLISIGAIIIAVALIATSTPSPTRASVIEHARSIPWQQMAYTPAQTDHHPELWEELNRTAATFGLTVVLAPAQFIQGDGGSDFRGGRIFINDQLPIDAGVETLAHELGHFFQSPMDVVPGRPSNPPAEVFADLVAFEVLQFYGYDNSERVAQYLSLYKSALSDADDMAADITFAVEVITGQRQFQPGYILFQAPATKTLAARLSPVLR